MAATHVTGVLLNTSEFHLPSSSLHPPLPFNLQHLLVCCLLDTQLSCQYLLCNSSTLSWSAEQDLVHLDVLVHLMSSRCLYVTAGLHACRRTKKWEAHLWDDRHQVYLGELP